MRTIKIVQQNGQVVETDEVMALAYLWGAFPRCVRDLERATSELENEGILDLTDITGDRAVKFFVRDIAIQVIRRMANVLEIVPKEGA